MFQFQFQIQADPIGRFGLQKLVHVVVVVVVIIRQESMDQSGY